MRVGLDIGGSKIDAVALSSAGTPVAHVRLPTGFGPDEVLDNAATAIGMLRERTAEAFASVGVGIPGLVDSERGHVRHAVNLGLDHLPFGADLESRIDLPVAVENDVNAAALGACHVMRLSGPNAYLNLGTGLAAGFVDDGRLWRGARGVSGEIGHIPIVPGGVLCPCGQRGCLETVASGSAIAREWPSTSTHPIRSLFRAADGGDPNAQAIRRRLAEGVASAIRILILTVDVDCVIVGGGLSQMGPPLLDDAIRVLDGWAAGSPFLFSLKMGSRVKLVPSEVPVAAIGAAMLTSPERRHLSLSP